jgi:hypothetical protein
MYGHVQNLTCSNAHSFYRFFLLINDLSYVVVLQLGAKFLKENGFKHVLLNLKKSSDGAL